MDFFQLTQVLGNLGEFIGSFAVLLTLLYLGIQVKATRDEVRRSIRQSRNNTVREMLVAGATNLNIVNATENVTAALSDAPTSGPYTTEMLSKGVTLEDAQVFAYWANAWWMFYSNLIPFVDELTVTEKQEFDSAIRGQWSSPAFSKWLEHSRGSLNADSVKYFDKILDQNQREPRD